MERFKKNYAKLFSIHEIENSKLLQILYYCVTLSFFVTFYGWVERSSITVRAFLEGTNVCPPYFQSCGEWYFLQNLPWGYSQGVFYVFLYLGLIWGVYSALRSDWFQAHLVMLVALLWKLVWIFLLTYGAVGNFDYYDMGLAIVLLFLPYKEYFAKVLFVWFYFLASTIKIHEGWIFGNYLNSLITGAPIFSEAWLPYFANLVIIMQIVGAWFLLSNNKMLKWLAFTYFLSFHIYSGFIVNYRYITISIPALLVLFGELSIFENKKFSIVPINKKSVFGYGFLIFLLVGQAVAIFTPGDQKKTLEGNYYGLFMFEANHQCTSTVTIYKKDGTIETGLKENAIANNRCDPYRYWYEIKQQCRIGGDIDRVTWTFDHSVNGHPFERVVDVENACELKYKSFGHNNWIKIDGEATVLDRPVYKNGYAEYMNPEKTKVPQHVIVNEPLLDLGKKIYWTLWLSALAIAIFRVLRKKQTK